MVVHQDCDQVLRALALVGAVLLEPESSGERASNPESNAVTHATNGAPQRLESQEVVFAPPYPPKSASTMARTPNRWVTGPLFGLSADLQFAPTLRLGPRLGWLLTHHDLFEKTRVELSVSFARLNSGSMDYAARSADISWSSVRLEACLGTGARSISTIGGCSWFDIGQLSGTGRTASSVRAQSSLWSRLGVALRGRRALIGALSLDARLATMLATQHHEFYFAGTNGLPEQSVHRTPLLELAADLLPDLHFW